MPVDKNVRGFKSGAARIQAIARLEVPFHLEIELLGKVPSQVDACPAQAETIL